MDIHKQLETVKEFVQEEIKCLQDLVPLIDCILTEIKLNESNLKYDELSSTVNVLISTCKSVDDANQTLTRDLNNISTLLKPTIQWHSNKKDMLEMFYLDGNSPWSIWLTYNPSTEIDNLYKTLGSRHSMGLLKKLLNPKVGDFICCYDKRNVFRAVITEVCNTRIKVINVDRYNVKIMRLDACFEMPKDLCEIHAYSIHCCLTKDKNLDKMWKEDLGRLLQNTLKECRLTVRIREEIRALPPLFVVEIYAFNEALEVETNISEWITARLFPELKNLPVDQDHILDYFSDEALDPFFMVLNTAQNSSMPSSSEQLRESKHPSPDSLVNVSRSMINVSSEETSPKDKPRNRLAHLVNTDMAGASGTTVSFKSDNNSFVAGKLSNNLNLSNFDSTSGMVPFKTVENVIVSKGSNAGNETNEVESVLNSCREDSVIPGNYIPTDDDRICSFFIKKGFCWKPSCKKLHTKISKGRWTEDTAEIFKETINSSYLPGVGSVITMKVTFVVLCNAFYALLPEKFSDMGEGCETVASLNKSLNSLETKREFKFLNTPPCLGQFVVAYSSEKSMWLRASVIDVLDNGNLKVFFVDYGAKEELPLDKCREIEPRFVHLPCQAIYCTLAKLFVQNNMSREGKLFTRSLLLDQEIEVEVIDSDMINNRLEVVAFHNGKNINELLIKQGYCSPSHC